MASERPLHEAWWPLVRIYEAPERVLVWAAMSELFLDTENGEAWLEQLAELLAAAPFTLEELDTIYTQDVAPALVCNAFAIAGEWVGFQVPWLVERIREVSRADRILATLYPNRERWQDLRGRVLRRRMAGPA